MTPLRPTRRDILKYASLMPAFAMPAAARAELGLPEGENPAHFRFSVGDIRITIVSDGWFEQPEGSMAMNADPEERAAFLASYFLPTGGQIAHTNHVYIETGDETVLIDVGSGSRFLGSVGRLMGNMETAGIDPFATSKVVITHAHPDHIWGIRDDFDEAIIPDAEFIIGEAEKAYWTQEGLVDRVPPQNQQFVLGAVNSINADGVAWNEVQDGAEVAPGVRMVSTPGHTPGHMSVMVESGDSQLLVLGDAITHAFGHFAHPEWHGSMDTDPEACVASRKALLDMAATDRIAVVGYHFPFPGVGHVAREGDGYRFVPALWRF